MSITPASPTPTDAMGALSFSVTEELAPGTDKRIQFGRFSRDWSQEEELDRLLDDLDARRVSDKQALLRAQKLSARFPGNLEIQNFLGNRLWQLGMRDEATEVWEKVYQQAATLIPKGYKGLISWLDVDNRSFLRIAHGYVLGLMHRGEGKTAKTLARKLLAWCPSDNLGVGMLMGDISLMLGDRKSAMKSFLNEAQYSPAHWYQAGQIAYREGDYVSACTYIRRGIAANPYIAEGLTGRTILHAHLYWHASNRNGPEWAADYLNAPTCHWTPQEMDFVDWVFNSAPVLLERAALMTQLEGLTYERDADKREPFARRSSFFVEEITDQLSEGMVRKVKNRHGVDIWPWER